MEERIKLVEVSDSDLEDASAVLIYPKASTKVD